MSSTYRLLCLDHAPALVLDYEFGGPGGVEAIASARDPASLGEHHECDLLIGRWSGGLVALGCPPHDYHPHTTSWVDTGWLRLLFAAGNTAHSKGSSLAKALDRLRNVRRCWTFDRLIRLRYQLDLEPNQGGGS